MHLTWRKCHLNGRQLHIHSVSRSLTCWDRIYSCMRTLLTLTTNTSNVSFLFFVIIDKAVWFLLFYSCQVQCLCLCLFFFVIDCWIYYMCLKCFNNLTSLPYNDNKKLWLLLQQLSAWYYWTILFPFGALQYYLTSDIYLCYLQSVIQKWVDFY